MYLSFFLFLADFFLLFFDFFSFRTSPSSAELSVSLLLELLDSVEVETLRFFLPSKLIEKKAFIRFVIWFFLVILRTFKFAFRNELATIDYFGVL